MSNKHEIDFLFFGLRVIVAGSFFVFFVLEAYSIYVQDVVSSIAYGFLNAGLVSTFLPMFKSNKKNK